MLQRFGATWPSWPSCSVRRRRGERRRRRTVRGSTSDWAAGECALLGRVYDARQGCARERCVAPAVPFKLSLGTEMCALPGQGRYGYGAAVEYRRCAGAAPAVAVRHGLVRVQPRPRAEAGHRRAAVRRARPRRTSPTTRPRAGTTSASVRTGSPSCSASPTGTAPPWPGRPRRGRGRCARTARGTPSGGVAAGPALSRTRPRAGRCSVGDSLTWRGTDELGELAPDLTIDGQPARQLRELAASAPRVRAGPRRPGRAHPGARHEPGPPATATLALAADIGSLPSSTLVMFVLPYRADRSDPPKVQHSTTVYSDWMRSLAASRPRSCVADWRAVVEQAP